MNEILRRRRALMGSHHENISIELVNGSYSNGFIVVSDGNKITVSGTVTQYDNIRIPLTAAIQVQTGDTLSYMLYNKTGTTGYNYHVGFQIGDTINKTAQDRPVSDTWYSTTATVDGALNAIVFQNRTGTAWNAVMEISIKVNNEVIF